MHKIFFIGDNIAPDEKFTAVFSNKGYELHSYANLSQSLGHLDSAAALIINNRQSDDKVFKDFLKASKNIPKIIIEHADPAKGIHKWLKDNLTYLAVRPNQKEIAFLIEKALHDKYLHLQFDEVKNKLLEAERELSLLDDISKALTSSVEVHSIIDNIMKHIVDITHAKAWSLYLVDEESKELYLEKDHKKTKKKQEKVSLKLGRGIVGWVAKEGMPVIVPDVSNESKFTDHVIRGSFASKKSIICVPIKSKGKIIGAIEVIDKKKNLPFTKHDLDIILKIVDHASLAIERASLYQKMAELAITDDLTKLFNSRYLNRTMETEIARCERYASSVSLIFMDIDYFKNINDQYGHLVGSKVLVEVGQLLIKGLRSIDIVSRYGGDEFVIVLPQTHPTTAEQIAERLRKTINRHVFLKSEALNLKLTASFGIASYPESAKSKEDLLRLADEAMYRVKNKTRNGVYSIPFSA